MCDGPICLGNNGLNNNVFFFLSCKTSEPLVANYHPKCLKGDVLLGEPETCLTIAPLLKAHLEGQCSVPHEILG